jgi:acetyl esterase/lipase
MSAFAAILFALSLLCVFRAPALPFWYLAIGATELGHFFAIGSLALGILARYRRRRIVSLLCAISGILFLTPWLRAGKVARDLPRDFEKAFAPFASFLPANLRLLGTPAPRTTSSVQKSTTVFARRESGELSLDVYSIPSNAARPCVIVVHGGSWKTGTRQELGGLNAYLAKRGFVVASIDYRLAPAFHFSAQRDDVFRDRLPKEPRQGLRDRPASIGVARPIRRRPARVGGGVRAKGCGHPRGDRLLCAQRSGLGISKSGHKPEAYHAASPALNVPEWAPPTLMLHGDRDELVSPVHDEHLSAALQLKKRPHLFVRMPWATHACDAILMGPCGQLTTYSVEQFLSLVLQ